MSQAAIMEVNAAHVPLDQFHRGAGAKMVPFAGYMMPLNYPSGIISEHQRVRANAGLFDVSHMGQLFVRPKVGGSLADVAAGLERLMPMDFTALAEGKQRYGLLTTGAGGILDDLMVARMPEAFFVVVNASRKSVDEQHLRDHLSDCEIETVTDRALLALQGPDAAQALGLVVDGVQRLGFMEVGRFSWQTQDLLISRSGYTGEDGYEISIPAALAPEFVTTLLKDDAVGLAGLGARDSLRLEAGLCLYGSDITEDTSPIEAGLEWAIQKSRREGGRNAGNFPGSERILEEFSRGPSRKRVGLCVDGRAPVRGGASVFRTENEDKQIGVVTSGCFGPTANAPVAMGYVPIDVLQGTFVFVEQRGKRVRVKVAPLPFVKHNYKRKQ